MLTKSCMIVVTIALETAEDEARLIEFLPTVHGQIVSKSENDQPFYDTEARRDRLRNAMNKMTEHKTGEKFGDASAWQREVRSWDRVLDGRDE